MELILARHGNTFGPEDPVVWVGAKNDLSLVASGELQADRLGEGLRAVEWIPDMIYTGPLLRMRSYAHRIAAVLNLPVEKIEVDQRLNEVDYGVWSGLTQQAVVDRFGQAAVSAWEQCGAWPCVASGWGESPELLTQRIMAFKDFLIRRHAQTDRIMLVSSNGALRFFLQWIPGLFEAHCQRSQLKMATGSISKFHYQEGQWALDFWNQGCVSELFHQTV
jgi:probable phosphoglycerate mutase